MILLWMSYNHFRYLQAFLDLILASLKNAISTVGGPRSSLQQSSLWNTIHSMGYYQTNNASVRILFFQNLFYKIFNYRNLFMGLQWLIPLILFTFHLKCTSSGAHTLASVTQKKIKQPLVPDLKEAHGPSPELRYFVLHESLKEVPSYRDWRRDNQK